MYPSNPQVEAVVKRITAAAHKPALGREPNWTETVITLSSKDAVFVRDYAIRVHGRLPMGWSISPLPESLFKLVIRR